MTKTIVFTATYNEKDNIENFTNKIFEINKNVRIKNEYCDFSG